MIVNTGGSSYQLDTNSPITIGWNDCPLCSKPLQKKSFDNAAFVYCPTMVRNYYGEFEHYWVRTYDNLIVQEYVKCGSYWLSRASIIDLHPAFIMHEDGKEKETILPEYFSIQGLTYERLKNLLIMF